VEGRRGKIYRGTLDYQGILDVMIMKIRLSYIAEVVAVGIGRGSGSQIGRG
jgi:hypothetical protein